MLMVSEMIEVTRATNEGEDGASALAERTPLRFDPATRRAPIVVWNVNRDCNMRCPHCYAAARPGLAKGQLTTAQGLRLLDDLAEAGVKVVIFSGGEPLLRQDLPRLIAHASRLGLRANLSSNGTLIDERMAELLGEAGTEYVGVSLDGPPEFNDSYRGLKDGYHLAVLGLRLAKAAGMRTGVRMTLTRLNIAYLEQMVVAARQVRANRFYVAFLVYAGRGFTMMGDDLPPFAARTAMTRLFEMAETLLMRGDDLRLVTGSNDSAGPLLVQWLEERYGSQAAAPVWRLLARRGGNSAGEGIIAIDARGRAHPDQFWHKAVLGDVRQRRFSEILAHPLCDQLRNREAHLKGRCGQCRFLAFCRGSHRERAEARFGDLWGPDPGCVMRDEEIAAAPPARLVV